MDPRQPARHAARRAGHLPRAAGATLPALPATAAGGAADAGRAHRVIPSRRGLMSFAQQYPLLSSFAGGRMSTVEPVLADLFEREVLQSPTPVLIDCWTSGTRDGACVAREARGESSCNSVGIWESGCHSRTWRGDTSWRGCQEPAITRKRSPIAREIASGTRPIPADSKPDAIGVPDDRPRCRTKTAVLRSKCDRSVS
jgi:hypothetical protein